jgi:predicted nucleotidyltransferase
MKGTIKPNLYLKLLIQTGVQKVTALFFKFPEKEFSLSDIAKETGVAKSNLGAIIDNLNQSEFLTIEKLSKIWRIKANKESWHFLRNKIVYNLNFVYQSGLIEFLYEYYGHPKSITLFGSFRKGEDVSSSDIDISIEQNEFKEYRTVGLRELVEFEKQIGRKIQIHEFNRDLIDVNLFNNIANGIVLMGFLEVKK